MKAKYLSIPFTILLLLFIIVTSIKDTSPFLVVTSPKVYSLYQTSDNESFRIQLLTNKKDSYYFNEDYILDILITGDDNISLPVNIKSIIKTRNEVIIDDVTYYEVVFELYIPFSMEDEVISIQDAKILLSYDMDETIELKIGEFNYLFGSEVNPFLTLGDLYTTHEAINGIDTVGSIVLELGNLSNKEIQITNVAILSHSVAINTKYVKPILDMPNMDDSLDDILGLTYDFFDNESREIKLHLREKDQITLLLPVSYAGSIKHIERFALIIWYEDHNQEYKMIVDDFPFIIRSPFNAQYQNIWVHHDFSK